MSFTVMTEPCWFPCCTATVLLGRHFCGFHQGAKFATERKAIEAEVAEQERKARLMAERAEKARHFWGPAGAPAGMGINGRGRHGRR